MKNSCYENAEDLLKNIQNENYNFDELKKFRENYVETADMENSKRIVDYILSQGVN